MSARLAPVLVALLAAMTPAHVSAEAICMVGMGRTGRFGGIIGCAAWGGFGARDEAGGFRPADRITQPSNHPTLGPTDRPTDSNGPPTPQNKEQTLTDYTSYKSCKAVKDGDACSYYKSYCPKGKLA